MYQIVQTDIPSAQDLHCCVAVRTAIIIMEESATQVRLSLNSLSMEDMPVSLNILNLRFL